MEHYEGDADMKIEHHEGLNYCGGAIELGYRANLELMENGLMPDNLNLGWDQNVVLARLGKTAIGVITWHEEKHLKQMWLTLSYVLPGYRCQGVFKAMWSALVEKAQEKGHQRIRSATTIENAVMRAVSKRAGRVEEFVQMRFDVPPKPAPEEKA